MQFKMICNIILHTNVNKRARLETESKPKPNKNKLRKNKIRVVDNSQLCLENKVLTSAGSLFFIF